MLDDSVIKPIKHNKCGYIRSTIYNLSVLFLGTYLRVL